MRTWKGSKQSGANWVRMTRLWYFKRDVFIPFCQLSDLLSFSRKLHDPVEAVQLTGLSSGQPAVHPLSRLDRPTVTYSAVKPWARGFEMWQHNQFPWFMIILKRGCTERLGSWKRRAEGECWQQSQFTDMYSSRENLCFWLCWLLARDILFPLNVL